MSTVPVTTTRAREIELGAAARWARELLGQLDGHGFIDGDEVGDFETTAERQVYTLRMVDRLCTAGYHGDAESMLLVQTLLARLHDHYFSCPPATADDFHGSPTMHAVANLLERRLLASEERFLDPELLSRVPRDSAEYLQWVNQWVDAHPAKRHPVYEQFLRDEANASELAYYLIQETTLDPRFDDVLALLQLGTSDRVKMEIARNYWDEMGNGDIGMMHTNLFRIALETLGIGEETIRTNLSLDAVACGNLSTTLAVHRYHFYRAIGYFGVTELMVPFRFGHVIHAWRRNGLDEEGITYHILHHQLDAEHGDDWVRNVIAPIIDANPRRAAQITQGIFLRLNSSQRYLDAMLAKFRQNRLARKHEM
ncbi:MAG TPA: iron-containing redox enzyme family protein [Thermoanaerobaculia bacterium]|nr:iron-containing redox enzyme family protein [Thermoanaerobaculia bacterium]